ncbi:MAG: TIGR03560 family F420-dependent LLM class oxidoreductase [Anaerolineales bacterium]|jgi:F420-dependent oxidoreductase-like protein
MIEVALMIEGQNGLTWERWKKIVPLIEDLGFIGIFRSDHYTNAEPPDKDSLELWVSLTWLADNTKKIEFGPLVTPFSFRHPSLTARMASAVDDLSRGRLILGVGAGWQEREHEKYGWDLLDISNRFKRFEEGLEVLSLLFSSDDPTNFNGEFFQLHEAVMLPRPKRSNGPPILIGGNGPHRTLALAAKYAREWNAVYLLPDKFSELNSHLDFLLEKENRKPKDVKRSMMTGLEFGRNNKEVKEIVKNRTQGKMSPEELKKRGVIVGTANEIVDSLGTLSEVGVERIMLQWLELDDLDRLEAMAKSVLPQI